MRRDKLLAEWFWTDRWMGSRGFLLPMEPRGLYREMLTQAWRRGVQLPNDHEAIARAVGCTAEEWKRCWPLVAPFWRQDGDRLVNDTQLAVYAEAKAAQERASERGRRGAQARAQAKRKHVLEPKPPSPSPSPVTSRVIENSVPAPESGNGRDLSLSLRGEYVKAVWDALVARRGPGAEMSTAEWDQARQWFVAGVPLAVVLRGILDCTGKPKSLLYVAPAVRDAIEYHRKAME